MNKLVYYKVPFDKFYIMSVNKKRSFENGLWTMIKVQDSHDIYNKIFVEEFTDRLNELTEFIYTLVKVNNDILLEYETNKSTNSVCICEICELEKIVYRFRAEKKKYDLLIKDKGNLYMILHIDHLGAVYMYVKNEVLSEIEMRLRNKADMSSFGKYELGE